MLGKTHNLLMQHQIYRALPHREGGGVPRDIITGYYDREAVRAQFRKELKCIRNLDMLALLAAHVVRLHSRTTRGAASLPACILARASASPRIKPAAATRTFASLLQPATQPATSRPSSTIPTRERGRIHRSTSRPATRTNTKTIRTPRQHRTKHSERDSTKPLNIPPSLPQTGQHPYAPTIRCPSTASRLLPLRPPRHASRHFRRSSPRAHPGDVRRHVRA
jgi:hypothetical protein